MTKRGRSVPAEDVPGAVMSLVFEFLITRPGEAFCMSKVCHSWRSALRLCRVSFWDWSTPTPPAWRFSFDDTKLQGLVAVLPRLRAIGCVSPDMSNVSVETLSTLPGLEKLALRGCRHISDCSPLARLTNLAHLDLSNTGVTDGCVRPLTALVRLEYLSLSSCHELHDDTVVALVRAMPSLRVLDVSHCYGLTDGVLPGLAGCALEELNLYGCRGIDVNGRSSLSGFTCLQQLNLGRTRTSTPCLRALSTLGSLRTLNLKECDVKDDGLHHLSGMTQLQGLDTCALQLTEAGLGSLAALKNLRYLTLRNTVILTVSSLGALLTSLPSLVYLNLVGCIESPVRDPELLAFLDRSPKIVLTRG